MVRSYISRTCMIVEQALDKFTEDRKTPFSQLFQAARYSLLNGGKRLRPVLVFATAEALGVSPPQVLSVACAFEMIHTYSLIHDDLPCMDDDDFRRGKPSLHKAFTEAQAVLAGDYLLTRAFGLIAEAPLLSPEKKVALIRLLSDKAGCGGMVAGQVMDIDAETTPVNDLLALTTIHQYKTGALIQASILAGAIIGEADDEEYGKLASFGNDIGLAFQIVDDVLDVSSGEKKRGSKVSSDIVNGKTTYVTLLGIDNARRQAAELLDRAVNSISNTRTDYTLLKELAACLVNRDN